MKAALIGHTGLIGTNLLEQKKEVKFDLYNSKNIHLIKNAKYDLLVIAAPSAEKWKANSDPLQDLTSVFNIIENIYSVDAKKLVLFSTIDVYGDRISEGLREDCVLHSDVQPYGRNRSLLESYCHENFNTTVVRLPALFGKHLKKNVIYDLMNDNMVDKISLRTNFQWINLDKIVEILNFASKTQSKFINYVSEPIETRIIVENLFPKQLSACLGASTVNYNVKTLHNSTGYFIDSQQTYREIENFVHNMSNKNEL
jgi:nucleoside-diphosphate-sugar epimerase